MRFVFHLPTKIHFGLGSVQKLPDIISPLATRVFLVSSPGLLDKLRLKDNLTRQLAQRQISLFLFEGIGPNPEEEIIEEAASFFRQHGAGIILGIGGGSALDAAKLIAVLTTNPGPLSRHCRATRLSHPVPPVVAVPTTAGSGSEVTPYAVITTIASGQSRKKVIRDPRLFPHQAVVDPLLTMSCPKEVVSDAGIDALCHALESFLSPRAFALSEGVALESLKCIGHSLPQVIRDGLDPYPRQSLMYGSLLSGASIALTGATLLHAMTYPITSELGIPHGRAVGLLLPSFWKHSYHHNARRFRQAYAAFTGSGATEAIEQTQVLKVFLSAVGSRPATNLNATPAQLQRWATEVGQNRDKIQLTPGFSGPADILSVYQDALLDDSHLAASQDSLLISPQ